MYDDSLTLKEARDKFFKDSGLSPVEYKRWWAKINIGKIPVYFFNFGERKKALPPHDLHHILTGYETTWMGEAEIGAWELASGCKNYYAAWYYNIWGMMLGLALDRKRTAKAFLRGLRSRNLYGKNIDEALLKKTLGELRAELYLSLNNG